MLTAVTDDVGADDDYDVDGNYDVMDGRGSCGIFYINGQNDIISLGILDTND